MRKLLVALTAIALLVNCNSSGKKETKSLDEKTITESRYFDSMVKPVGSARNFEKDLQAREKIAIKRLEDIRELQENYKNVYGQYVSTMESLMRFYKEGTVPSLLQIGCKEDSVALIHTEYIIRKLKRQGINDKDIPEELYQIYLTGDNSLVFTVELKVAVRDKLFCDRLDFCIDSLEYIPFSGGEMVTMDAVIRHIGGVNIPLFEACVPYRSLLRGLDQGRVNDLVEEKLDRGLYPGLKVGDIERPNNNAGNWE